MDENGEIMGTNLAMLRTYTLRILVGYGDLPVCVVESFAANGMPTIKPCNLLKVRKAKDPNNEVPAILYTLYDPDGNQKPMKISKFMEFTAKIKDEYGDELPVLFRENDDTAMLQNLGIAVLPPISQEDLSPRLAMILGNPVKSQENEGEL